MGRTETRASGPPLTVASAVVRQLLDPVDDAGADGAKLARDVGIAPDLLDDLQARVPEACVRELLARGPSVSGDASFGLHAGERSARGGYGVLEYFIGASPSLRDGLTRLAAHYRLLSEAGHVAFEEDAHFGYVSLRNDDRPVLAQESEYFASAVVTVVRRATGIASEPSSVDFAHPAPADTRAHERLFRAPVRFGAPSTRIAFSKGALAKRLLTADEMLSSVLVPFVSAADDELPPTDDVVQRARAALIRRLEHGGTIDAVAHALGMSRRSLQRALAERGTSFRALVEEVRKELALGYIADPRRELAEIAALLAFSRTSAFQRAFRRWTGKTPMACRAELQKSRGG